MDVCDLAEANTASELEALLTTRPAMPRRDDLGIECHACGEDIPQARRRAVPGCCLCVDCQEQMEGARP